MFTRLMLAALSLVLIGAAGCAGTQKTSASWDAEPDVRVRIIETLDQVSITPQSGALLDGAEVKGPIELEASDGSVRAVFHDATDSTREISTDVIRIQSTEPGGDFDIPGVPYGVGWWWEGTEDRTYEGTLEVRVNDAGHLTVIVELPVEEYLRGVVPSEIGSAAPAEALKAQAVAARSETMTALFERQYADEFSDICADVDCQVFSGIGKATAETDAAIQATRGIILSYDGKPIPAYYASNCGGHSESVESVWPDRDRGIPCWSARFEGPIEDPGDLTNEEVFRDFVTSKPNVYCNPFHFEELPDWTEKNFRWERETSAEEMSELIAKKEDIGRVVRIEPLKRGQSGRLESVRFVGTEGIYEEEIELSIRRLWEPPLRSSAFIVETEGGDRPDTFRFIGAGYGHGVGMCQTGAMARAYEGQSFREILEHYYKDVEIQSVYD